MSYGPDGFNMLELKAERLGRFNLIRKIAKTRDEAERGYIQALSSERAGDTGGRPKIKCPRCSSEHVVKSGFKVTVSRGRMQQYKCMGCGHIFVPKEGVEKK